MKIFLNFYVSNTEKMKITNKRILVSQNIWPSDGIDVNLGDSTRKFNSVYAKEGIFDSNSVYLGNKHKISVKEEQDRLQFRKRKINSIPKAILDNTGFTETKIRTDALALLGLPSIEDFSFSDW